MAYEFAVNMTDQVSPAAHSSGDAVAELSAKMRLAQMDIAGVSNAFKASQTGIQAFASGVVRVSETTKAVVSQVRAIGGALASGDVPGAIGAVTNAAASAAKMLDGIAPGLGTALSQILSVAGGFIGAVAGVVTGFMAMAIHSAEGKERVIGFYQAMGNGVTTGAQYAEMVGALANKFGFAGSQMKGFAQELLVMGHRDLPDLRRELVATSSAQALMLAMNENGGASYVSLARKINAAESGMRKLKVSAADLEAVGLSAEDIAGAMGMTGTELAKSLKSAEGATVAAKQFGDAVREAVVAKGKGPLEAFSHSLDGIKNRFTGMIGKLFAGADIKPFLRALEDVVAGFGQVMGVAKGSGGAMNGLFIFAGKAVKWLSLAFLDVIIWVGGAIDTVSKFFSATGGGAAIVDTVTDAVKALVSALKEAVAIADDLSGTTSMKAKAKESSDAMGEYITKMKANKSVRDASKAVPLSLGPVETASANDNGVATGKALSDGVASGITSGSVAVVLAAAKMADSASNAVKSRLKVQSPSRVMIGVGENVSAGFAIGMRGGIPDVEGAARDLSRISIEPSNDAQRARGEGTRSERRVGDIIVHVQIDGAGLTAQEITEEMVAATFERIALATGTG